MQLQKRLRSSIKKLIKEHHPDQFKGLRAKYEKLKDEDLLEVIDGKIHNAEEMCKLFNEAFEVLSDPVKRKQYDAELVETTVPMPEITIRPTKITFGSLNVGEKKSSQFTIDNKGGPVTSIHIDWEGDKPNWGELVIEPDPDATFPIKVEIKVDTTGVSSGPKNEKVLVNVDGRVHMVEVFLAVTKPISKKTSTKIAPTSISGLRKYFITRSSGEKIVLTLLAYCLGIVICFWSFYLSIQIQETTERKIATQTAMNIPVNIVEAKKMMCFDLFNPDEQKDAVNRGIRSTHECIVFKVSNQSQEGGASVSPAENLPIQMNGSFYNVLVDPGSDFPCDKGKSAYLEPGETGRYVCFAGYEINPSLCLDLSMKISGVRYTKTSCVNIEKEPSP